MGIRDFILDVNMVSLKKLGFDETTFELEIENFQITNTEKNNGNTFDSFF